MAAPVKNLPLTVPNLHALRVSVVSYPPTPNLKT